MPIDIPSLTTLADLAERIEGYGDRTAAVQFTRDGRDTWSYARLCKHSLGLSLGLREAGVRSGEKIAVMAEPSPEWFVAAMAIARVGATLVPIDAQMADEDLERVFDDSGVRRIFSAGRIARRIEEIKSGLEVILLDKPDENEGGEGRKIWRDFISEKPAMPDADQDRPDEGDTAILFYTSGTTGPPKGVPLSHRNILFQIQSVEKTGLVNEDDRMLLPLPLHHVYPLVIGMFTPLALGVAVILPQALTGDAIVRALSEGKGSLILGVPRLYRALYEGIRAKAGGAGRVAAGLFAAAMALSRGARRIGLPLGKIIFRPIRNKMGPRVRLLASGGSPLDPDLAESLEALGWPIAVGYGLTETSPLLTIKHPNEGSYASVGRPIDGVEIKIDPSGLSEIEDEAPERDKQLGEVLARGESVFSGYHNLAEKSKKSFSDGWFRTGDIGFVDEEGFLHLGGRVSSMIVREGGENINPEDLEGFLAEVGEVSEIGVLEEKGKLVALAIPDRTILREHKDPEKVRKIVEEAVRTRSSRLPSYKQLSHVEITREPLPVTRLGKVKRHILAERYQQAKKGDETGKRQTGPTPIDELSSDDRTLLENPNARKLWDLFAKRYPETRLSPDASLDLDIGIDSLEWVELSLSAHERTGLAITEELIEKAETVRDLLEEAASGEARETKGRRPIEAPEEVLSDSDRRWATPRGPITLVFAALLYGLLRALIGLRCRVEVEGFDRAPDGPCIFVANHVSFLDGPALVIALGYQRGKQIFWAGQAEILFRNLLRRAASRLFQVVPIDARRGPLSSLAVSALVVKRGHSLAWFPEGHISTDGTLQDFRAGIGLIADHYEPVIVPVFIDGTHDVMPLGRKIPRSGVIKVHFGEPLDGSELKARAEQAGDGEIHERIARVLRESVKETGERAGIRQKNQQKRRAA